MALREKSTRPFTNNPNYYKTRMCKDWEELDTCPRGARCTYAHGEGELKTREKRPPPKPLPKAGPNSVCRFYASGYCKNGDLCNFKHTETKKEGSFEEDWYASDFNSAPTIDADSRFQIGQKRTDYNSSVKPRGTPQQKAVVPAPSSSKISSSEDLLTEGMTEMRLAAQARSMAAVNTTSIEAFPWTACLHIFNLGYNISIQELKEMFGPFNSCGWEFGESGGEFVAKVYFVVHADAVTARKMYAGVLLDGKSMRFEITTNPNVSQSKDFPQAQSLAASSKSALPKEFFFGDANTADFTLVIGDDRFLIHKEFVAHHSTFLKGVFAGSPKKVYELDVKERSETLKDVLDIIYEYDFAAKLPRSGDISGLNEYLTRSSAALRLAHEMGIRVIRRYFEAHFHRWLCPSSCSRCTSLEHLYRLAIAQLHRNNGEDADPVVEKFRTLVDLLSIY